MVVRPPEFMTRFVRLAGFLGAKAGTPEEQARNFKWVLNDIARDKLVNMEFSDVAEAANAARNIKILQKEMNRAKDCKSKDRKRSGGDDKDDTPKNTRGMAFAITANQFENTRGFDTDEIVKQYGEDSNRLWSVLEASEFANLSRTGTQDAIDAAIADRLADPKEVNSISENHVGVLLFVLSLGIKYDNEVNKVGKISKIYIVASRIMNDDEVNRRLAGNVMMTENVLLNEKKKRLHYGAVGQRVNVSCQGIGSRYG
ncbi:hypothetical protein Tco_0817732 [Tanacetum coccineum]